MCCPPCVVEFAKGGQTNLRSISILSARTAHFILIKPVDFDSIMHSKAIYLHVPVTVW